MAKTKKTAVISIKGLNNRDVTLKREDGYCSSLHNMTFRNGCWRGVCGLSPKLSVTSNPDNYKIIYKHPILGEDEYIAYHTPKYEYWKTYFSHVRIVDGAVQEVQRMFYVTSTVDMNSVRVSHYGSVLYFSVKHDGDIYEQSQIFFRGSYADFNFKQIPPFSAPGILITTVSSAYDQTKTPATQIAEINVRPNTVISGEVTVDSFKPDYREIYDSYAAQGYITGSVVLFVAYKMYDGTVIRNGDAVLLMPQKRSTDKGERLYRIKEGNVYRYCMNLYGYTAKILLASENINAVKDIPFIDSIVIYGSRPEPIYDIDSVHTLYDSNHPKKTTTTVNGKVFEQIIADTLINKENYSILGKPFYRIAEIDFRNGEDSFMMNAFSFRNIEEKEMYKPNFSVHDTISAGVFDYNGYLHRFSLKTFLYSGGLYMVESPSVTINNLRYVRSSAVAGHETVFVYTLSIDGRDVCVRQSRATAVYRMDNAPTGYPYYVIMPNFITYPDSRAYKLSVYISQSDMRNHLLAEFPLQPAYANNYAYFHKSDGEIVSGYMMFEYGSLNMTLPLPAMTEFVLGKNQMVVSDRANPYSFAPADIYSVGDSFSTEIMDMNIPAEEISDARFGDFPVYLFTTTGIYALEQGGSDSIYKGTFMINNDRIKSGGTSLVRNGCLFYLSGDKICSLKGRVGENLSGVMAGNDPETDFGEYVSGAVIYMHEPYGELIVYNSGYDYAYVYSLEAGMWSTRDFSGVSVGGSLLLAGDVLYDLSEKEDVAALLPSKIILSGMRLADDRSKVVEQLRIDYSGSNVAGSVYCENKAQPYSVRRISNKSYVRRLPGSWKTITLELRGRIDYINCVVIDYYIMYER